MEQYDKMTEGVNRNQNKCFHPASFTGKEKDEEENRRVFVRISGTVLCAVCSLGCPLKMSVTCLFAIIFKVSILLIDMYYHVYVMWNTDAGFFSP